MSAIDRIAGPWQGRGTLGGIPFACADGPTMAAGWARDLAALLGQYDREIDAIVRARVAVSATISDRRIQRMIDGIAHQRSALAQLFADAGLAPAAAPPLAPGRTSPLLAGWRQILRDWAWDDRSEEARIGADAVCDALRGAGVGELGEMVVLGAGAGRMPYELHLRFNSRLSLLLDINPIPALVGHRVIGGQTIELVEFPSTPVEPTDAATTWALRRRGPPVSGLYFAFDDARAPALPDAAFDTLLTCWYIDQVDQPFADLIAVVRRLLRPGGLWINTGPLVYRRRAVVDRLSLTELLTTVTARGFAALHVDSASRRFLCSPVAGDGRIERVHTMLWRRDATIEPSRRSLDIAHALAPTATKPLSTADGPGKAPERRAGR